MLPSAAVPAPETYRRPIIAQDAAWSAQPGRPVSRACPTSAEPFPRRVLVAGVEVDHEPVGRDQRLLLQALPLLPRLHSFDRVAVADDITALEDVVPGVAQVGGKARQFHAVAVALEIGQPEHLE